MPPYWVLVIIAFFACNAQTFMETGAMVTSIRNFDTERYIRLDGQWQITSKCLTFIGISSLCMQPARRLFAGSLLPGHLSLLLLSRSMSPSTKVQKAGF